jgi:hypothetical protein
MALLLIVAGWFFLWCKTLFPYSLLHPTSWFWPITICRMLLQTVISLALAIPLWLILVRLLLKFLTPDELLRVTSRWNH